MAATDIIISGLSHAIGQIVEVVIGGLDCGAFTVASSGNVTVPIASVPVPTGFPDAGTYFLTVDVGPYDKITYGDVTNALTMQINGGGIATMYLPIYVGFLYPSIAQVLRPTAQQETKSQLGGSIGKLRRVWSIAALFTRTQGVQIGTNTTNILPAQFKFANQQNYAQNVLFDGVHYMPVEDADSFDGMPLVYAPGPYPCILNSLTGFTETKERA